MYTKIIIRFINVQSVKTFKTYYYCFNIFLTVIRIKSENNNVFQNNFYL